MKLYLHVSQGKKQTTKTLGFDDCGWLTTRLFVCPPFGDGALVRFPTDNIIFYNMHT
jgi:hypothetical protein